MLIHPDIDPVALHLGPVKIYWYGIMYLLAFLVFIKLANYRRKLAHNQWVTPELIDVFVLYGVLGVVIGGRLGQVFLYEPTYYWQHPLEIFEVWHGGMSFHGGLLGIILISILMSFRHNISFLDVMDFIAPIVIPGYILGRIGNFINSELVGRPSDLPWAMIFPHVDNIPRHPSQLYQALVDGLLFFIIMWVYTQKPHRRGQVSGVFMILYAVLRSITECFKVPDDSLTLWGIPMTIGQYYCIPMAIVGVATLIYSYYAYDLPEVIASQAQRQEEDNPASYFSYTDKTNKSDTHT